MAQGSIRSRLIDADAQMKDVGAVTSSAAATVGSSAVAIDLTGDSDPHEVYAEAYLDVSAIDTVTGDETYAIVVEGCDTEDFTTGSPDIVPLGILDLSDAAATGAAPNKSVDGAVGQHRIPFSNVYNGKAYRYARLYTAVGGTTPSINYVGWLAQLPKHAVTC